jgi:hypothetical protein
LNLSISNNTLPLHPYTNNLNQPTNQPNQPTPNQPTNQVKRGRDNAWGGAE